MTIEWKHPREIPQEEIDELVAWFTDLWENHRDELPVYYMDVETWDRMMEDDESN